MPQINTGEFKLHYTESGEGVVIIFLHGFTLDHRMWFPQVEYFSHNYRVICPDARGHGFSDAPSYGYSRPDRVEDLAFLVDKINIESFHLVGLSMGGSTAIGYALKYPEKLKSLYLVSSGIAGYGDSMKMSRFDRLAKEEGVEVARQRWKNWTLSYYENSHQETGEMLEMMMDKFSGATWLDPMRGKYPRPNDFDEVQSLEIPTAIIAGELDKTFVELAEKLHQQIPKSSLKIYKGTGHILNLEREDEFNRDLSQFIKVV